MRVLWALAAEQDRADIVDTIAQDNPLVIGGQSGAFYPQARRRLQLPAALLVS